MSGEDNIYKYIITEGKIMGEETKRFTMLEYLQKSTGVFNQDGMLSKAQVKAMKKRAQTGEKNIWHGFISFDKDNLDKIDDPEKCIALVKRMFIQFFKDAGFDPENIDLMCALHLDRPEHLHIHFVFWEKEPKVKNQRATGYIYRKKGKIPKNAIDKMTERLNAYTIDDNLASKCKEVIHALYKRNDFTEAKSRDIVTRRMKELAEKIPKDASFQYARKDMISFRQDIDFIVEMLFMTNTEAFKADMALRQELDNKEEALQGIMSNYYKEQREKELHNVQNKEGFTEIGKGLKTLHTIEALRWDYKRRLGNIVLHRVKWIQEQTYKRNPKKKYNTNDKALKRSLAISSRKVRGILGGLFSSVVDTILPTTAQYHNRLREIEEEMKQAHAEERKSAPPSTPSPTNRWDWGK